MQLDVLCAREFLWLQLLSRTQTREILLMALTQIQIIQSLGEALSWMEKEINWGVPVTELRHLSGRIGELYAALISNGQMATEVNQKGYDVVSENRGRISVKTTAQNTYTGHFSFNPNTLDQVDWIIALKIDTDEMEIQLLLDAKKEEALELMRESKGHYTLPMSKLAPTPDSSKPIKYVNEVQHGEYTVREAETGSFEILKGSESISPVKPTMRKIAKEIGVDLTNINGNTKNTRQLGASVIQALQDIS
ncbi:hypothetical protein BerOc1_03088 [Pseudodesulfovibrio hydrargyri]|uniref:DUF6998 domain-containing protein n=1 Tax=Pseudodesulfovibrio hydrargyri TaxID=2125990 RepID=A0A1J5ND34_9BACT|nr:hypothetical protein [Pseudodesulfovibrio hydrargyri]OIQ51143.1 hypothetical protein BerOc1_03088 [Pseudodesulfovibrio hydrargyri]